MSKRRRFSQPLIVKSYGKVLNFDWDLFLVNPSDPTLTKEMLEFERDYLIMRGNYAGKIARFVGKGKPGRWGPFRSTRGDELRVRIDQDGFACIPNIGCWRQSIHSFKRLGDMPPVLLLQACSIVGAPLEDELHVVIREGRDLVAQFSYRNHVIPETIDMPRLEETIVKLGSHKKAHPTLRNLVDRGFFVCYEDDGWLLKCDGRGRVRWMRRSHIVQITVCRCGQELMSAMMDDTQIRSMLPCRMFGGFVGKKSVARPGVNRRSSSFIGTESLGFDLADLMDDYDKSLTFARIFRRRGACDGNFLVLESPFMDAVRSYIDNGGLSRNVVCTNFVKWRHLIKNASGGDDPYNAMEDVRVVNAQWQDCLLTMPNSRFKSHSFSVVYYDGTIVDDTPKVAHKVLKVSSPKDDIAALFTRELIMNGGFLVLTLSRKGIDDESLPALFDNVEDFVTKTAKANHYSVNRIALGVDRETTVFVDFQVYRRVRRIRRKAKKKPKKATALASHDERYYDPKVHGTKKKSAPAKANEQEQPQRYYGNKKVYVYDDEDDCDHEEKTDSVGYYEDEYGDEDGVVDSDYYYDNPYEYDP